MTDNNTPNGKFILIVEDDPGTSELETQRLESLGLEIRRASSAEETIGILKKTTPALMLLDYSLSGSNAIELVKKLKGDEIAVPPFLMVTGRGDETVAVETMKAGASDYLVKNSDFLENLLPAARKALEKAALKAALETAQASTAKNLRLYTVLAQVNQAVTRQTDKQALLQEICDVAVATGGFKMAWVGMPDRDTGRIIPACSAGFVNGYLDKLKIELEEKSQYSKGPTGCAAISGKICLCADTASDPAMAPWREKALERGYRSSAAIPLEEKGKTTAVITIYSEHPQFFSEEEVKLLGEIRSDVSLALDAINAEKMRASAQAALELTASQLTHVMETNPVILFRLRAVSGRLITEWVSGNVQSLLGYDEAEMLVPDWIDENLHPEDKAQILGDRAALIESGNLVRDFRIKKKGNGYIWVHEQIKTISKAEYIGSWTDITRLKESEERFHYLFEKAPINYQSLDEEGRLLEVNETWLTMMGYAREEVLGRNFRNFLAPEYRARFEENFRDFKASGIETAAEYELLRKNGGRRRVSFNGKIAHNPDGTFKQTHCVFTDITETWKARAQTDMLSQVIKSSFDEIYIYDPKDFHFIFVNYGAIKNLGYSPEELETMAPWDLKKDFTEASFRARTAPLLAGETSRLTFETTHTRKDGTTYPVQVRMQLAATGKEKVFLAIINDITERKRAELELAAQRRLFSDVINNSASAIYAVDLDGKFILANNAIAAVLKTTPEQMTGRSRRGLLPEALAKQHETNDALVLRSGKPRFFEEEDGQRHYFYSSKFPLRDPSGKIYGVCGISADVTEQKTAQLRLEESESRFRTLVDSSPYGVLVRKGMEVIFLNKRGLEIIKAKAETDLAGKNILDRLPEKFMELVRKRVAEIDEKQTATEPAEIEYQAMDGTLVDLEITGTPIVLSGENCGLVFFRDISEKKKNERLMAEMTALQRVESLGLLAGGIAHDFNNMLTGILANISLLEARCGGNKENADILHETIDAARNAQSLTASLLAFSKGGKPVKKEFCLQKALRDIFSLATRGTKAACEAAVNEDLWSVEGDENQLKQAINNLLINALQAMPSGGSLRLTAGNVSPGAALPEPLAPGKYIRLTVTDTGIGIPKEYLGRIFEPYFTTKSCGHGLGLSMTWSVVKNHNGHIEAASVPGQGTTFEIYLPATGRCMTSTDGAKPEIQKGSGRILVLEDEEVVAKAVTRMLKELGYACEITGDGGETVRRYAEESQKGRPFDLVIMDLTIPGGMGGKEAVVKLRAAAPGAKVIVSSGYSDETVMADFRDYGFDAVLPKPYKYEDLAEVITRLLKK